MLILKVTSDKENLTPLKFYHSHASCDALCDLMILSCSSVCWHILSLNHVNQSMFVHGNAVTAYSSIYWLIVITAIKF